MLSPQWLYFLLAIDFTQSRQFSILLFWDLLLRMPPNSGQDEDKLHFLLHFISFNKYVAGTYTDIILPAVLFLAILLSCCFYRWRLGSAILRYIVIAASLSQTCRHKSGDKS